MIIVNVIYYEVAFKLIITTHHESMLFFTHLNEIPNLIATYLCVY